MMIVPFLKARGDGLTTSCLALGASWPHTGSDVIVAELNPAGGDLGAWFDLPSTPGLLSAAAAPRGAPGAMLRGHCQVVPGGMPVLAAPMHSNQAKAAIDDLATGTLTEVAHDAELLVLADCGLWTGAGLPDVVAVAPMVVVVVRQDFRSDGVTVGRMAYTSRLVDACASQTAGVVALLIGSEPYTANEVASFLGIDVIGTLDQDEHGAALVAGRRSSTKASRRCRLLRSARTVAARLDSRLSLLDTHTTQTAADIPEVSA
jgi:hypothetical protein